MIYLRNRYYDPTTGRFITEDPVKDGVNWYSYCSGNPVGFVDPWGLSVTLTGLEEEKQIIFDTLQMLTRDDLWYFSDEAGNWQIQYKAIDGNKYSVGTELIRRIIDNGFNCLIISHSINACVPVIFEEASTTGTGSKVYFNPYSSKMVYTEYLDQNGNISVKNMEMPLEIILGHELIHCLRAMGGNFILYKPNIPQSISYGKYQYQDKNGWFGKRGKYIDDSQPMEELATTGISYLRPDGTIADAANWRITENALRKEHGYGRRVRYGM